MTLPRIAVTMGDPAGVGPEICLRLLNDEVIASQCVPVMLGDADVLRRVAKVTGLQLDAPMIEHEAWSKVYESVTKPSVLDLNWIAADEIEPGKVDARCGDAAFCYVTASIE